MKRVVLATILFFASCNADPSIVPDPIDGSVDTSSSSGSSSSSSASSSASSSSSSSASSSSGGPQGDGSGTRLKRYIYTSADGLSSEYAHRFFDSLLQADCTPTRTPNGVLCVTGINGAFVATTYYADAACSVPLAYAYKGCAPPLRMPLAIASTCVLESTSKVVELVPYAAPTMYSKSPACLEVPTITPAPYDLYETGPEVDYTQFAAMALEHE